MHVQRHQTLLSDRASGVASVVSLARHCKQRQLEARRPKKEKRLLKEQVEHFPPLRLPLCTCFADSLHLSRSEMQNYEEIQQPWRQLD